MKLESIIFRDLTSLSENDTVRSLLRTMVLNRIFSVPIVNELNEYIGCISESDILDKCIPPYMKTMNNTSFLPDIGKITENLENIIDKKIKKYIPKDYPTVKSTDSISYAADLMNKHNRIDIPVVDEGKLVGRVSRTDLLSVTLKKSSKK